MCHHPTIIAAHSEGRRWRLEGDAELKSKFWGRSIELHPLGLLRLTFADGDEYTWSKARPLVCHVYSCGAVMLPCGSRNFSHLHEQVGLESSPGGSPGGSSVAKPMPHV